MSKPKQKPASKSRRHHVTVQRMIAELQEQRRLTLRAVRATLRELADARGEIAALESAIAALKAA